MNNSPKRRLTIEYDSPVILTLALVSLAVLLLSAVFENTALFFSIYGTSLRDPLFYVRLISHIFGHASFSHFFGNVSLLLIIGPSVEKRYGSADVLLAILFTAVVEGFVHCLVSPNLALLGMSGIVFMLIFLAAAGDIGDGKLSLTFVLVALIYFGEAVYTGIFSNDNVSQLAHIVGGCCGIFVGWAMRRDRRSRRKKT